MRHPLIFILTLFISMQVCSQRAPKASRKSPWSDTTLIVVNLPGGIAKSKVVVVDIGKKAMIYLEEESLREKAVANLSNDFNKATFSKIIQFLDSASFSRDTVLIDIFTHDIYEVGYLVSEELQRGNAKVFYKRVNAFVPGISHRLEKYGMYAYRFFYLPDKRPFFSMMEYSGIIEKGKRHSDYNELLEAGKKIASLREQ